MSFLGDGASNKNTTIYDSPTFEQDFRIHVNEEVGSASIAPSGRDVVLASQHGLHIIDLDSPYSPPRHLRHDTPWTPADVQWSPFAARYYWVASTSNQRALVWNLELGGPEAPIEHILHAHTRAITDINFSAHHPDMLATCAVDSFVHCWDLRTPARPAVSFSDWYAGASQVKWNRQDSHIVASAHDRFLQIWDDRKGAIPVTTIDAHATKIYGVDWNRTAATKLITCSLDRTIKLWDYASSDVLPERVIQTPYPVWRARHTPFGCGLIAMPQRGDNGLHMYDRRPDEGARWNAESEPNYSFTGHHDQVKEFLWRARGTINNNSDNRDFQLVSWGADRELILHRMQERPLKTVGFEKGMHLDEEWLLTRRGSPYTSFRDEPAPKPLDMVRPGPAANEESPQPDQITLIQASTSPGMSRARIPVARNWISNQSRMTYSNLQTRNEKQQDNNLITWMKGVRIGKRGASVSEGRKSRLSVVTDPRANSVYDLPENLSDEIVYVGDTFKRVKFEEADIGMRKAAVSFNGPWGPENKPIYMKLHLQFPQDYPEASIPRFQLDRTSSIPDEKVLQLESEMVVIAKVHVTHQRGCLEAVLSYLLGEHTLQQSISRLLDDSEEAIVEENQDNSSSDEEDGLGGFAIADSQTLEIDGVTEASHLDSNPLPKGCGALWASDGRLVCFFPRKEEPASLLDSINMREGRNLRTKGIFEGFGRLHADSPEPKPRTETAGEGGDDSEEYESSSSSSSSSEGGVDLFPGRFYPPKAWQGASLRFRKLHSHSTDGSVRTSAALGRRHPTATAKTVITLHDLDNLLPAKRFLAEEYAVYGSGPSVCSHNAVVASRHGLEELADVWKLIRVILSDEVPLNLVPSTAQQGDVYTMARRVLRVQRKDSGLGLSFNQPESVLQPAFTSMIKWGNHPFGSGWLIHMLFDHFEKTADVQMLAMLACVFAEPAPAPDDAERDRFPASMQWPAQSLKYSLTEDVAFNISRPSISISASPSLPHTQSKADSGPASDGQKTTRVHESEPGTPFSIDSISPDLPHPVLSRSSTSKSSAAQSISVSPEYRVLATSNASSFATSMWTRPFNLAASPPQKTRLGSEDHLSAASPFAGGVQWNLNTIRGSNATMRRSYLAQQLADNREDGSDTEEDEPGAPEPDVKLTLKNQHLFDDEGQANVPFLQPRKAEKYAAYRTAYAELLDIWGLTIQSLEVLKFNGLSADTHARKPSDAASQTTLTLWRSEQAGLAATAEDGLVVVRRCLACGHADVNGRASPRCLRCGVQLRLLPCAICQRPISALYKACMSCGHTAHLDCVRSLINYVEPDELECESGCGCNCLERGALCV